MRTRMSGGVRGRGLAAPSYSIQCYWIACLVSNLTTVPAGITLPGAFSAGAASVQEATWPSG